MAEAENLKALEELDEADKEGEKEALVMEMEKEEDIAKEFETYGKEA